VTRNGGKVTFVGLRTIDNRDGLGIAMNRNGSIEVVSIEHVGKKKVEKKESYPVVYGAIVRARDGETVSKNTVLVEWDSYTNPIVTEATGRVKFGDILEASRSRRRSTRPPACRARSSSRPRTRRAQRRQDTNRQDRGPLPAAGRGERSWSRRRRGRRRAT
jgi:hypothetical protein